MHPDDFDPEVAEIFESSIASLPEGLRDDFFDSGAADFYYDGWINDTIDSDARQEARDEFFSLMEEFFLDAAEFDWDAWRDWYE